MAKKTDITKMNDAELAKDVMQKQTALRENRFAIGGGSANVKESRELRRAIARMKTEMNRRSLASS